MQLTDNQRNEVISALTKILNTVKTDDGEWPDDLLDQFGDVAIKIMAAYYSAVFSKKK